MIVYFSATGNSKYVAKKIAQATGDRIRSIDKDLKEGLTTIKLARDEALGIVSPVYFFGMPSIVREYLIKLNIETVDNHYIYLVNTFGGTSGTFVSQVKRLMERKNLKLSASYGVEMPDTWTPVFDLSNRDKIDRILEKSDIQLEEVIKHIEAEDEGDFNKKQLPDFVFKMSRKAYEKARHTDTLTLNDRCRGCGICAEQCPVDAIEIKDGKAVWVKKKCVMCLGCLHKCPMEAIERGRRTAGHGQYVNPNIEI